jgi:hypothetical protein
MSLGTARNAWTSARPAPIPAFIASSAPVASSGNSAAKRPRSAAKIIRAQKAVKENEKARKFKTH